MRGNGRICCGALKLKTKQGVQVYFLYNAIGSHHLSDDYTNGLPNANGEIETFKNSLGKKANRFQISFRNHRKIVVVDGHSAFMLLPPIW